MTVDTLAVRICRAIGTPRGEKEAWVALDVERHIEVDPAAAFTRAKDWLAFGDEAANLALLLDRAP